MKNTIAALCVLGVLCWAAGAWAQGQGKGRQQRPTRTENPAQAGNTAQEAKAKQAQAEAAEKAAQAKQQAEQKRAGQQAEAAKNKATKGADDAQKEAVEKAGQAKGKDHQQQMRAFEAQLQRHRAKHMERQARLARIRELAVQKGDAEMIARVDKLISKEQQVHERKGVRLQEQKRTMMGSQSAEAPTVERAPKGKGAGKSGIEKPEEPEVENEPKADAPQEAPPQN